MTSKSPVEIQCSKSSLPQNAQWQPEVGNECMDVVKRLRGEDLDAQQTLLDESRRILSRCVPPDGDEKSETGLVMGYVQSGKTSSFTTVVALANDNNYQLVVVIAGISTLLTEQSRNRLTSDLNFSESPFTPWMHFSNPREDDAELMCNLFSEWDDADIPHEEKKTVLITVLKHHVHLRNLAEILRAISDRGFSTVPALIIDDEGDQASLNTLVRRNEESTTYRRIEMVRNCLSRCTYLQYTATPQAILFLNILDKLSPSFAEVLEPGEGYVGGQTLFAPNSPYVGVIPASEIPEDDNYLDSPPTTLKRAMAAFFIGVAVGIWARRQGEKIPEHRSMMIHPDYLKQPHSDYGNWVKSIRDVWVSILSDEDTPEDKIALLDLFKEEYHDLAKTCNELPAFEKLLHNNLLRQAIKGTRILILNSDQDLESVPWSGGYAWILIGGQSLDRGFTVKGLTVTYMPRKIGVGNADTIQQRARFFGYKSGYLGLIRVFMRQEKIAAYEAYVEHEQSIRDRLQSNNREGRPLNEMFRRFVLNLALKPCRKNVVANDWFRDRGDAWWKPKRVCNVEIAKENNALIERFLASISLVEDTSGHSNRSDIQKVKNAKDMPLRRVYEELLAKIKMFDDVKEGWVSRLMAIKNLLDENPDARCTIFQMSQGETRERDAKREDKEIELSAFFMGANPKTKKYGKGEVYPGDTEIHGTNEVAVQIHNIRPRKKVKDGGEILGPDMLLPAIWMRRPKSFVVQPQGGPNA